MRVSRSLFGLHELSNTYLAGVVSTPLFDTNNSWDIEAGYAAMVDLLSAPRERWPSAVVVACDTLAVGALRAAREVGVRVPADLALVGFDNTMAAFTNPSLTTIDIPREQLGRLAVRRLLARQQHPDEPSVRIVEGTTLVVGESSGVVDGRGDPSPPR